MSNPASGPVGLSNGTNGAAPGQPSRKIPPQLLRRKRPADPLVARKKPLKRPPTAPSTSVLSATNRTGITALKLPSEARTVNLTSAEEESKKLAEFEARRKLNDGWTDKPAPDSGYQDFPVVTTKRALRESIRYHVMRFAGKTVEEGHEIDPTNQDEFTRPVSLHRRDPRQPAPGRVIKERQTSTSPPPATEEEKEAEKMAQQRAERQAQRALDMAQIAPIGKEANGKKPPQPQKKEKQFQMYFPKKSAEQKKETEIRYEEALPWHLEDADGKNVWVGSYVSALSEANVALVISGSAFRMVPLEKFYRFTPKPPFQAYSIEQAEEIMGRKMAAGRWAMRDTEKKKLEDELEETRKTIGGRARIKLESSTFRSAPRSEKMDHDDIDMEGDEFQDDDENVGLEPENDEDSKDARERQRRNHLGANLFGDADEREIDKEEQESKLARKTGELGKQLRKALAKREAHLEYLEYVDSDTNSEKEDLFESSSDDEDDEEDKKDDDAKAKADKEKLPPAATPKDNTTPMKQKPADGKKVKSLKRAGSPNLSESSGNESSRKKAKKLASGSMRPSRSTTPMPGQARSKVVSKGGSVLSDGEATAGEMSDGAVGGKKRIKIVSGASRGTPSGSRATSPNPTAQAMSPASNPGSPERAGSPPTSGGSLVEASEIVSMLQQTPEGISLVALLRKFGNRIGEGSNQMKRKDWIRLVKETATFGEDKLLRPKAASSSGA